MYLCYRQPADYNYNGWEKQALPLGNGKIGAKIFGGIQCELIQFNEKTLWSGGPDVSGYNYGVTNADNGKAFREIQQQLLDGKYDTAVKNMDNLRGNENAFGAFQAFGNMYINFNEPVPCSDNTYLRDLDLATGSCMVACRKGIDGHNRHYFISYPDNVFVGKIESTGEDMLDFTLFLQSEQNGTIEYKDDTALLYGTVNANIGDGNKNGADANNLRYGCAVKIVTDDGVVTADKKGLTVTDCFNATIIMSCATDYAPVFPSYRRDCDPLEESIACVEKAAEMSFNQLFKRHLKDFKEIMGRVNLNIGQIDANLTTDAQLKLYKKNKDPHNLEALLFNYGRYLLISSSREGSLPANLQGIWNSINNPKWNSDYHLNINLQMNYFHAFSGNMAETAGPLLDYANLLVEPGRYVANTTMGIGENKADGSPDTTKPTGWVVHTQTGPMGMVGPGSDWHWGWAPTNGAFLMHNCYEYYEYTKDIQVLKNKIYPTLEECSLLFTKALVYHKESDRYVCVPSLSPEHGPVSVGCTYDQTIVEDLFRNTLEAAAELDKNGYGEIVNKDIIAEIEKLLPKLKSISLNKKSYIKEWYNEDEYSFFDRKKLNIEKHHRHTSHLLGVYPFSIISERKHLDAAKKTLDERGIKGPGWSQVLKTAEYARIGDSKKCYELIQAFIKRNVYANMFANHPPFQIDANFGYTAAVIEMLMQSHRGYIELLPALPEEWKDGSISGIVARGNFEVSIDWNNMKFRKGTVKSNCGGKCSIYCNGKYIGVSDENGNDVETVFENGIVSFETTAGTVYNIY